MTRGFSVPRHAVLATTTRGDSMPGIESNRIGMDGRSAILAGRDERYALQRDHAFVEAAAVAALRSVRA